MSSAASASTRKISSQQQKQRQEAQMQMQMQQQQQQQAQSTAQSTAQSQQRLLHLLPQPAAGTPAGPIPALYARPDLPINMISPQQQQQQTFPQYSILPPPQYGHPQIHQQYPLPHQLQQQQQQQQQHHHQQALAQAHAQQLPYAMAMPPISVTGRPNTATVSNPANNANPTANGPNGANVQIPTVILPQGTPVHLQQQQQQQHSGFVSTSNTSGSGDNNTGTKFTNSKGDKSTSTTHKLRRGPWSPEEDKQLLDLVAAFGGEKNLNWVKIAQLLETRTAKQARERYHQNLKPSLNRTPITPEEGKLIEELVERYGKRWAEIARHLHGRSDNAIKNWWNGGTNRRKRLSQPANNSVTSPASSSSTSASASASALTSPTSNGFKDSLSVPASKRRLSVQMSADAPIAHRLSVTSPAHSPGNSINGSALPSTRTSRASSIGSFNSLNSINSIGDALKPTPPRRSSLWGPPDDNIGRRGSLTLPGRRRSLGRHSIAGIAGLPNSSGGAGGASVSAGTSLSQYSLTSSPLAISQQQQQAQQQQQQAQQQISSAILPPLQLPLPRKDIFKEGFNLARTAVDETTTSTDRTEGPRGEIKEEIENDTPNTAQGAESNETKMSISSLVS